MKTSDDFHIMTFWKARAKTMVMYIHTEHLISVHLPGAGLK